jgi:tRNA(Arg) A34 adenosine deaminase TadA
MTFPPIHMELPDWIGAFLSSSPGRFSSDEERMELVIRLSELNVQYRTGGPFAAGIFTSDTGELIAPGVNTVVVSGYSIAHAEIMALTIAQQVTGSYDLSNRPCELVTSTEPCAMCLGAIPWSGVRRIVCGARDEDAERIGFDEGPKPRDWPQRLRRRGIDVRTGACREQAVAVLQSYASSGGIIYNGRKGDGEG